MKITLLISAIIVFVFPLFTWAQFGSRIDSGVVEYKDIDEASGITSSKQNKGVLWTHNDKGDENRIYAMGQNGKHLGIYYLKGCEARDWEDIATGPGPDAAKSYIYLGNIGDNDAEYDIKYVYRCVEPNVTLNQSPKIDTIKETAILAFRFPDGKRDAEALMVDPLTKDYYVISKRDENVRVYLATYPQPITTVDTLMCIDTLALTKIVAADISPSGTEIIMKDYQKIYYWQRSLNESIREVLKRIPKILPYTEEYQGEGLTWDGEGKGYFTLSEEDGDKDCHLYYYPRLDNRVKRRNFSATQFQLNKAYVNNAAIKNSSPMYLLSGRYSGIIKRKDLHTIANQISIRLK